MLCIFKCPSCSVEVEVDSSQTTCTCRYCGIEMAVFEGRILKKYECILFK